MLPLALLLLQAAPDTVGLAAALERQVAASAQRQPAVPSSIRDALAAEYGARGWLPLWYDGEERLTPRGAVVVDALRLAPTHGLPGTGYPGVTLSSPWTPIEGDLAARLAARDVALSMDALRFARALAVGLVDPVTLDGVSRVDADGRFDPRTVLTALTTAANPAAVFDSLAPAAPAYRRLRAALAPLHELADRVAPLDTLLVPDMLAPGDSAAGLPVLVRYLVQLGDADPGTAMPAEAAGRYDEALVEAVRRFQRRHGLVDDGVLGPATRAALATPLSWRARQVELALERWRWFAEPAGQPVVDVDVAAAHLSYRDPSGEHADFEAAVIVGNAEWQTPVLESRISRIVLHPPWIVPVSIAREELIPAFLRDSSEFAREGFQLLRDGDTLPPTPENLAAIGRGVMLRQQPGPRNSLGRIKLEVATTTAIHLHDTPTRRLFGAANRFLSHGCVRVHRVEDLARLLLAADAGWTDARFAAALAEGVTRAVTLRRPVVVRLRYMTASVDPDGRLQFHPDRYDRDRRLDEALRR
jgi:murein L,D-transpeptidase YcbB/YkuD